MSIWCELEPSPQSDFFPYLHRSQYSMYFQYAIDLHENKTSSMHVRLISEVCTMFSLSIFKRYKPSPQTDVSTLVCDGDVQIFEIIGYVYQYLKLLHQVSPQEWIFKELQDIGNMEFRFAEEQPQDDYAAELAGLCVWFIYLCISSITLYSIVGFLFEGIMYWFINYLV